ncbi:MAG: DUF4920 domain-containing protein [Planctomycetota bacterium]
MRNHRFTTLSLALALAIWASSGIGCAGTATPRQATEPYQEFGDPIAETAPQPVSIEAVMNEPEAYIGNEVVLSGTVRDVCQKRGCWMTMGSDTMGEAVIVKFTCPIDGYLIPPDAAGRTALAAGVLELVEVNEGYARHLAEDNGATPEEIAQIVGPQEMLWLGAPSARVYGLDRAPELLTASP